MTTPPPLLPGMRMGELVMGKQLGAGGFGTVHLASHGPRRLAVKFLNLRRVGAWRWREADLLNRLEHPNVVRFLGCGCHPLEAPRFFYIVMEYVEGQRLDRWADAENPTARRAVQVLAQLARALEAVHGVGALHRDLKEANVMVGAGDHVTLIDFGMGGHAGAAHVTPLGLVPGTPGWRAASASRACACWRTRHVPARAWRGAGAALLGGEGAAPLQLAPWQEAPIPTGQSGRVILQARVRELRQGPFTLRPWETEAGGHTVTLSNVTFP